MKVQYLHHTSYIAPAKCMHLESSQIINAMAKAKRMSDIFASSAEKDTSAITTSATPYSSEGPTLPIIGADNEHASDSNGKLGVSAQRKRKAQGQDIEKPSTNGSQPIPTLHPALYEPWTLLPAALRNSPSSQARLRGTQNVVPIVFTKNQNVKAGINRMKTYLGAYKDKTQPLEVPEALKQTDAIIAVSAQGEGTSKLVSILDVAKRVVAPSVKEKECDRRTIEWWVYTSLASVEVERKAKSSFEMTGNEDVQLSQAKQVAQEEDDEEDAFEPMEVDAPDQEKQQQQKQVIKAPVLTVWITKKKIPAFKETFGEQVWEVNTLLHDD
jgi:hypothetical protein